jgi:hypothetical protein
VGKCKSFGDTVKIGSAETDMNTSQGDSAFCNSIEIWTRHADLESLRGSKKI